MDWKPLSIESQWQTAQLSGRLHKTEAALERSGSSAGRQGGDMKAACAELESLFVYEMLKAMRATVPKSGLLDGGQAEETYTAMMDMELSKHLALRGDLGIASLVEEHLGGVKTEVTPEKSDK